MKYRSDIEGLRAIAVLAVLLYHFHVPGLDGGFIGVDVFFVISGYLITSLLISERQRDGRISIISFYARRARRLLPISAVVLVGTAIAGAALLSATRLQELAEEVTSSAFFAANVLFADRGTNYLTAALEPSPLRHYWSLAVEEQFYVVWPALIALVTMRARNVRVRTAWAMGVIVVVSYALSGLLTADAPSWSYFGLHTRAWELGVGALLASLAPNVARIPGNVRTALGWTGLAAVAVSAVTFGNVVAFPGWAAAVPVVATAAVLVAGDHTPRGPHVLLGRQPLLYIGTRSYSLYLWHWPILILAEARLGRSLSLAESLYAAACVVAIAEVGYRYIEHPIRTSRPLTQRPSWSLAMGGALIVLGLGAGIGLDSYRPDLSTGVVAAAPAIATTAPSSSVVSETTLSTDTTIAATTTTEQTAAIPISMVNVEPLPAIIEAAANEILPDNLRPPLLNAKNDVGPIYANGCHQYYDSEVKRDCVFGDPNGSVTIALWGDSHAAQWFPALDAIAKTHGWRLLSITQGGCPYLEVEVFNKGDGAVFRHCVPWRQSVRAYLIEQQVDVVFVSEYYGLRAASDRNPFSLDEWRAELPEVIDGLRADGIEPVVIGDVPDPPKTMPGCLSDNRRSVSVCAARTDDPDTVARNDVLRTVTAERRVSFIEPSRWTCANGICPTIVGDILAYRDGDHLSNTFMTWLTPAVEAIVVPFVDDYLRFRV